MFRQCWFAEDLPPLLSSHCEVALLMERNQNLRVRQGVGERGTFLSLPLEGGLGLWRIYFPPLLFPPFFSSKFFILVSLGPEVAFYTSKSNLFLHSALFSLSFPQGVRSEAERSRRRKCGGSLVTQPRLTDGWGRSNRMSQPVFTLKAAGAIVMSGFPLLLECAGGKTPLSQEENP